LLLTNITSHAQHHLDTKPHLTQTTMAPTRRPTRHRAANCQADTAAFDAAFNTPISVPDQCLTVPPPPLLSLLLLQPSSTPTPRRSHLRTSTTTLSHLFYPYQYANCQTDAAIFSTAFDVPIPVPDRAAAVISTLPLVQLRPSPAAPAVATFSHLKPRLTHRTIVSSVGQGHAS